MKRRSGFTLLELLMVVSIIAILVALLAPAVMSVMTNAKNSQVKSEIIGLDTSLTSFKTTYGVHPPSSITLYEQGGAWSPESRKAIRQMFGLAFDFDKNRDFNGNGVIDGPHVLTGQECLVFFLGGMPKREVVDGTTVYTVQGFSHSKSDPFSPGGESRVKFFDFNVSRLQDKNGNGFPEYVDHYGTGQAYAYFRKPYDASHCPNTLTKSTYYYLSPDKPYSDFQIITAGADGRFGDGGNYKVESANTELVDTPAAMSFRAAERDNITNFHTGPLAP